MTAPGSAGSGATRGSTVWITVLEFARAGGRPFEVDAIQALIEQLTQWRPTGLCHPDRYAIQLHIRAGDAHQALERAVVFSREAARSVGLPGATLVRVEVMTVDEYERSLEVQIHDPGATSASGAAPLGFLCDELYLATRRLHTATSPHDLTDTVIRFVLTVGGRVEPGAPLHLPGTIDVDVTLEGDEARHATAEALSVAGLILGQLLPALLHDARQALARLRQNQPQGEPRHPPKLP